MSGYTRSFNRTTGDTINASDFVTEFQAVDDAFDITGGHRHDGSTNEAPYVPVLGDIDGKNKVVVDPGSNHVEIGVEVGAAYVSQVKVVDGAIVPVTDNDIDLGSVTYEFKDMYIDGTAYIDSAEITTLTLTDGDLSGNLTVDGNTTLGDAATDTITLTGEIASNIIPSADGTYNLGSGTDEWNDLYIDGTANIDSLVADTADINAGTIDNTIVGGTTPVAGSFTTLTVNTSISVPDDALATSKIAAGALPTDVTVNNLNWDGNNLSVSHGGTGRSTLNLGKVLVGNGTSTITAAQDAPTGDFVGTSDAQTLTNKTIDAFQNTVINMEHGNEVDNPSSGVHGVTGDIVGTTDTQTLTNKTLTSPTVNSPTITTPTVSGATGVTGDVTITGNLSVSGTFPGSASGMLSNDWTVKTSAFTAVTDTWHLIDLAGALTVTLPAGTQGDRVRLTDVDVGISSTNILTIAPNGSEKILGVAGNQTIQYNKSVDVELLYTGATYGWVMGNPDELTINRDSWQASGTETNVFNDSQSANHVNGSTTLVAGNKYNMWAGSSYTIYLPLSPSAGDRIILQDMFGKCADYPITVDRNGEPINYLTENLVIDIAHVTVELLYFNGTAGWVFA